MNNSHRAGRYARRKGKDFNEDRLPQMIMYSTFTNTPEEVFQGYAFVGADYVYGPEGAEQLRQVTGESVKPGRDGCYVTVRAVESGWEFGVDAFGMARLFYYQVGSVWAISSSLAVLVDHLRSEGVRLNPNFPQLSAFGTRGGLAAQMTSFRTVFQEIELVPSTCVVVLRGGRLTIKNRQAEGRDESYEAGLSRFLKLCVSRLAGLMADERVQLECDLSGGIDSRTLFAMVQAARAVVGESHNGVAFMSDKNREDDFVVASAIAERYDVVLNPPREQRLGANLRRGRRPVSWRDTCLGNYLPIYFTKVGSHPFAVHCHGGGGELYRRPYPSESAERLALTKEKEIASPYFGEWKRDFMESSRRLQTYLPTTDPVQAHYREFRNRFHFGHRPHGSVVLLSLNSSEVDLVTQYPDVVAGRQLYFDVMESLVPGLAQLPYDKESKAPSVENTKNLTVVDVLDQVKPGRVFASESGESGMNEAGSSYGFKDFISDGELAVNDAAVQAFVGAEAASSARRALAFGMEHGRFSHPNAQETKDLTYCVTVAWALDRPLTANPGASA